MCNVILVLCLALVTSHVSTKRVTAEQCEEIRQNAQYWKPEPDDEYNDADFIVDHLYLGNVCAAHNESWLRAHNVTYVVSMAHEWDQWDVANTPPGIRFMHFSLEDSVLEDETEVSSTLDHVASLINDCVTAIRAEDSSQAVLVHCNMGISRSSAAVIAYLQRYRWPHRSYAKILAIVKARRPVVRPNNLYSRLLLRKEL